jgi:hypothetical protein
VVTEESAARYFGYAKQVGGSDHGSICKPSAVTDRVHQYLLEFLLDKDLLPGPASLVSGASAIASVEVPRPGTAAGDQAGVVLSSVAASGIAPEQALRNTWHPPEDLKRRGTLTPCRFTVNLNYRSDGKSRWERYGDVLVWLDNPPTADDVYLVPSRKAPKRFRDPKQLEKASIRAAKQRLTEQFVTSVGSRALDGYWFTKTMAVNDLQRVHVYASEYDDFLSANAAKAPRALVYISYKGIDNEWRLRLRKLLDADERIESWDDSKLIHGIDFLESMKQAVGRTRVMVVLASEEYLNSQLPNELELAPAIAAADAGELRLLWVPIRPFDWRASPLHRFMSPVDPTAAFANMSEEQSQKALRTLYGSVCQGLGLRPQD